MKVPKFIYKFTSYFIDIGNDIDLVETLQSDWVHTGNSPTVPVLFLTGKRKRTQIHVKKEMLREYNYDSLSYYKQKYPNHEHFKNLGI